MWSADVDKTRDRCKKLLEYYKREGLNADDFHCSHYGECLNSQTKCNVVKQYSGGTVGVTPFYDLSYNGKPIRILIVGKENAYMKNMEYGTSPNFKENCLNILNCINWENKNNHIKGTLMILENILGVKSDYAYASYALTNLMRCSFQNEDKLENASNVNSTSIMKENCLRHLIKEIEILEPTLIIFQGEWAISGKNTIVDKIYKYYGEDKECLLSNANGKYGLYKFKKFMLITCHHPAILGNWIKNLAPDSVWPPLDYLRKIGYLPTVDPSSEIDYLNLVKDKVDKILKDLDSNDKLRK